MSPFPPFIRETLSEPASARKVSFDVYVGCRLMRERIGSDWTPWCSCISGLRAQVYRERIRWTFFTSRCL